MLLLLLTPGQPAPSAAAFVNFSQAINELWPPLNALSEADAVFWTASDLYGWINQAAKRLALNGGVFTRYDNATLLVTDTATYTLPTDQIRTIQADLVGSMLKPRNVQQVEALDSAWPTTAGTPVSFLQDTQGTRQLRAYPIPNSSDNNKALGLCMQVFPADLTAAGAILAMPQCLQEYFTFFVLGEARITKETRAQMPEISKWCRSIVDMLDGVVSDYWGQEPGT